MKKKLITVLEVITILACISGLGLDTDDAGMESGGGCGRSSVTGDVRCLDVLQAHLNQDVAGTIGSCSYVSDPVSNVVTAEQHCYYYDQNGPSTIWLQRYNSSSAWRVLVSAGGDTLFSDDGYYKFAASGQYVVIFKASYVQQSIIDGFQRSIDTFTCD